MGRSPITMIFEHTKKVIYDLYDNGVILELPKGYFIKTTVSEDRLKLLKDYIWLLLNTEFISEETKLYLSDRKHTPTTVADDMELLKGRRVKMATVASKIRYDRDKVTSMIGENIVVDCVIYYNRSIEGYRNKVDNLLVKYNENKLLDSIDIKIRDKEKLGIDIENDITDEEIDLFLSQIEPYIKKNKEEIENKIDFKVASYIKYIDSKISLSDTEKLRLEKIKNKILR